MAPAPHDGNLGTLGLSEAEGLLWSRHTGLLIATQPLSVPGPFWELCTKGRLRAPLHRAHGLVGRRLCHIPTLILRRDRVERVPSTMTGLS